MESTHALLPSPSFNHVYKPKNKVIKLEAKKSIMNEDDSDYFSSEGESFDQSFDKTIHYETVSQRYNYDVINVSQEDSMNVITKKINSGLEDAFIVADLGEVYRMYKLWNEHLPNVKPFYAIKSNPDPYLLQLLVNLGVNFDCASMREMEKMLAYGIDPSRIIYANPCKQSSHARFARDHGVLKTTFDNIDELRKISQHYNNAELFLRILPMDCHSKVPFGEKFGAEIEGSSYELLVEAKKLGLNVVGISFHVGSDCLEPKGYIETILRAKKVYEQAKSLGINMTTIDIGGGFPGGKHKEEFIEIAANVRASLDLYFDDKVEFIAEPGRYFSASCFKLAANVIAKRVCKSSDSSDKAVKKSIMYYLNDGAFKSFAEGAYIPQIIYTPNVLTHNGDFNLQSRTHEVECSLWGPALGAKDKINVRDGLTLPELAIGDWLYFENMGSYSICFNIEFNGFEQSPIFYTNTEAKSISALL